MLSIDGMKMRSRVVLEEHVYGNSVYWLIRGISAM